MLAACVFWNEQQFSMENMRTKILRVLTGDDRFKSVSLPIKFYLCIIQ